MKLTDIILIASTSFFTFHVKVLYFSLLVYFFSLFSTIFKNEVKDKNFSMYCGICPHVNKLKILLSSLNLNSDIICISESRITKSNLQTSNVHIPGYNTEQGSTESSVTGSLICISQNIFFQFLWSILVFF